MPASSELRSYGWPSGGRGVKRLGMLLAVVSSLSIWMQVIPATSAASQTTRAHNGKIVFRRWLNNRHTRGDIFTINPDGTGLYRVTHTPRGASTEPDPSPNGRWIDYMVIRHGNLDKGRLFKIRPNGSHRTSLSKSCTGVCVGDGFPDWSSTGLIAFQRTLSADPTKGEGFSAIFVMTPIGTGVRQITLRSEKPASRKNRYHDGAPGWSPSGRRIAFERVKSTTNVHAIFTVRLNGAGSRRITPWKLDASQPQYSPNGRWIAFRSCENCDTSGNIWLVHPDGSHLHQLTHAKPGAGKWASCAFSPDGRWVVSAKSQIVGGEQQNADVFAIRVSTGAKTNVTDDPTYWDSAPDWGIGRA
jgi:Tol biopolymer transport system component